MKETFESRAKMKRTKINTLRSVRDIDINDTATSVMPPLHAACNAGDLNRVKELLAKGANINSRCALQNATPLHIAVKRDCKNMIEFILRAGANVNAHDMDKATPLHYAAKVESAEAIKLLLKYGANINAESHDYKTVLREAVDTGNSSIVRLLLKNGANPNESNVKIHKTAPETLHRRFKNFHALDDCSYTVLNAAVRNRLYLIVRLLINHGADVNAKDAHNRIPLFYAIVNTNLKMFKLLLNSKAKIENNADLLHTAVYLKCTEIVEILLESGIDVNGVDACGRTAMYHTAAKTSLSFDLTVKAFETFETANQRGDIAKMLHSKGACVNAQDKEGKTALHDAAHHGFVQLVEVLLSLNANVNVTTTMLRLTPLHCSSKEIITRMLLEKGADINSAAKIWGTPLHTAARNGYTDIVETLLTYGANVNDVGMNNETPLHQSSREIISRMLLEKGADVNSPSEFWGTPLHIAAKNGYTEITRTLLEYNANVNAVNRSNEVPLYISVQHGNDIISEMLFQRGAEIYDIRRFCGTTALHDACKQGKNEKVKKLLKYGSVINEQDELGETALSFACRLENISVLHTLLDHNPDMNYYSVRSAGRFTLLEWITIDNRPGQVVDIVVRHIIKLKALNVYVADCNLKFIDLEGEWSIFYDQCKEEAKRVTDEKIGDTNVSFYDLITTSIRQTATYITYTSDASDFEDYRMENYSGLFVFYRGMIDCKFERVKEKVIFLSRSVQSFNSLFSRRMPDVVTEMILSYLTDNEQMNLIDACHNSFTS